MPTLGLNLYTDIQSILIFGARNRYTVTDSVIVLHLYSLPLIVSCMMAAMATDFHIMCPTWHLNKIDSEMYPLHSNHT